MVKKEEGMVGDLFRDKVLAEKEGLANTLYDQSRFGEPKEKEIQYSLIEAFYLFEKGKMLIKSNGRKLTSEGFVKKARKIEPNFWVKYCVFKNMRSRGYIVKTALKFGADFRVYDRGVKPGEDHAKWILFPVHESNVLTWYDFSAKTRVAHSTRKKLLLGIVDDEDDVTYYEVAWTKP